MREKVFQILTKGISALTLLFSFTFSSPFLLADSHSHNKVSAENALKKLKDGNERFVSGKSIKAKLDLTKLKDMSDIHEPFAVVIGCSDSRAPIEMIFDHGLGDLFILRTAGQVAGHAAWGSIEYAVELLGVNSPDRKTMLFLPSTI